MRCWAAIAGASARETGAATLSALAARFGRDRSSYSRAVRRGEENLAADRDLRKRAEVTKNAIMHD